MNTSMKCVVKSLGNVHTVRPIMVAESGAISRAQVASNFNLNSFSRRTSLDIEKQINDIWSSKSVANPRLYNGTKFRLGGWQISGDKCVLNVGLTNYKELCGTNLSPNYLELQERGRTKFDDPQTFMSDTVGVGILLITSDGCLVVTRRAPWTGEYPGMLDRPGGHPEPDKILTAAGGLKPEFQNHLDINEAVMEEIWDSAAQEAEDEVGLSKDKLQEMRFLGISLNGNCGDRPSLEYFARLSMRSEEVRDVYEQGRQREADESTALHLIPSSVTTLMPKILFQQHQQDISKDSGGTDSAKESPSKNAETEKALNVTGDDDLDNSLCIHEAKLLLEEATPALKAGLMLAHDHHLL